MDTSTIAAIATPIGGGGIGIVRISGKDAVTIAEAIFKKAESSLHKKIFSQQNTSVFSESHHLNYGHITGPESKKEIDEVLVSVMHAPHSYTRETVVEINAHSGIEVLRAILAAVLKCGARLAEPGEFTKRAYLNGRIDLTQAEAVIDIINAKTSKSLELATSQIKGGLRERIEAIRDVLLHVLTEIEAAIDFPEDVGDVLDQNEAKRRLENNVLTGLNTLVQRYHDAHIIRDGLKMIVVGKPNVGKSSLVNCLIQKDKIIVTEIPGTTRDLIEETISIYGVPVNITDTAGLHKANDPIEAIGIQKTKESIETSDLVLFMIDASTPLSDIDLTIYDQIKEKEHIIVFNKTDLIRDGCKLEVPAPWKSIVSVKISALCDIGIEKLKKTVKNKALADYQNNDENMIVPNMRHALLLKTCVESIEAAIEGINRHLPAEIVAIDLQDTIDALGEILGTTAKPDVLDQIFSRFCVGK